MPAFVIPPAERHVFATLFIFIIAHFHSALLFALPSSSIFIHISYLYIYVISSMPIHAIHCQEFCLHCISLLHSTFFQVFLLLPLRFFIVHFIFFLQSLIFSSFFSFHFISPHIVIFLPFHFFSLHLIFSSPQSLATHLLLPISCHTLSLFFTYIIFIVIQPFMPIRAGVYCHSFSFIIPPWVFLSSLFLHSYIPPFHFIHYVFLFLLFILTY